MTTNNGYATPPPQDQPTRIPTRPDVRMRCRSTRLKPALNKRQVMSPASLFCSRKQRRRWHRMSELPRRITDIARGGAAKTRRLKHTFHRAFVQWFETAQHRFAAPVRIVQVRLDVMTIALRASIAPVAGFVLGPISLHHIPRLFSGIPPTSVAHSEETLCWIPNQLGTITNTAEGWFCNLCPAGQRHFHASREAAWAAHLFEPLLAHANHRIRHQGGASTDNPSLSAPGVHIHQLIIGPELYAWSLEPITRPARSDSECRLSP